MAVKSVKQFNFLYRVNLQNAAQETSTKLDDFKDSNIKTDYIKLQKIIRNKHQRRLLKYAM